VIGQPVRADRVEQGAVLVSVVRWLGERADPPGVEAELVDADGERWSFEVAAPLVAPDLTAGAQLPQPGRIRCKIVRDEMVAGVLIVHVDTEVPDGLVSLDGVSRFRVLRASVP
jgi:hypothetical protein